MAQKKRKIKKQNNKLKKNSICIKCPAPCCRDLAMMITKPRTRAEIDDLKWHLHYNTVSVAIRNYRWYLTIKGKCIYLDRNNMCKIYAKRPLKCRQHLPPDCEKFDSWYDVLISRPEELEDYLNGRK